MILKKRLFALLYMILIIILVTPHPLTHCSGQQEGPNTSDLTTTRYEKIRHDVKEFCGQHKKELLIFGSIMAAVGAVALYGLYPSKQAGSPESAPERTPEQSKNQPGQKNSPMGPDVKYHPWSDPPPFLPSSTIDSEPKPTPRHDITKLLSKIPPTQNPMGLPQAQANPVNQQVSDYNNKYKEVRNAQNELGELKSGARGSKNTEKRERQITKAQAKLDNLQSELEKLATKGAS